MKGTIIVQFLALTAIGFAQAAVGQSTYPMNPPLADNTLGAIQPYRGTYYDPKKGGTGIQVDMGQDGNAFITFYAYKADGSQTFYITQGKYIPSDEITRWTTGVIGTVQNAPFYTATGGECIGYGCAYQHSVVSFTSMVPTFKWVSAREVLVSVGSQSWDMIAINVDTGNDGDYLNGTWQITYSCDLIPYVTTASNATTYTYTGIEVVEPIAAVGGQPPDFATLPAGTSAVNAKSQLFQGSATQGTLSQQIIGRTVVVKGGTGANQLFWYDPTTKKMGYDSLIQNSTSGVYEFGIIHLHFDLYLQNPDKIVGRGTWFQPGRSEDGRLNCALNMIRMPGGATAH